MGKKVGISLGLVMLVAAFLITGLTGTALAAGATGDPVLDGPDYPYVSDPVGTDVTPHNGYSATTDYCLQCHDIHQGATLNYAWLNQTTVTAVCQTCHAVGTLGSGPVDPAAPTGRFDAESGGAGPGGGAATAPPGSFGPVTNVTSAGGLTTYTIATGLPPFNGAGDQVWIWGVKNTPSGAAVGSGTGLNGTFRVCSVPTANTFTIGKCDATLPNGTWSNGPTVGTFVASPGSFVQLTGQQNTLSNTRAYAFGPGTVADPAPGTAAIRGAYTVPGPYRGGAGTAQAAHKIGATTDPDGSTTFTAPEWSYGWRSNPGCATPPVPAGTNPAKPGQTTAVGCQVARVSPQPTQGQKSGDFIYPNSTENAFLDRDADGGLMCTSCHTPHGEFGQLINKDYLWIHDPRLSPDTGAFGTWPAVGTGLDTLWRSADTPEVDLNQANLDNKATPVEDSEYISETVKAGSVVYLVNTSTANLMSNPAAATPCVGVGSGQVLGSDGYCIKPGGTGMAVLQQSATITNPSSINGGYKYWQACVDTPNFSYNAGTGAVGTMSQCIPWKIESQDGGFARPDGGLVSTYGYKLLSAYPNHTWNSPVSWGADFRLDDQPSFCAKCHPERVDSSFPAVWTDSVGPSGSGTFHNHPTPCAYCHGNPSIPQGGSNDFPHTSTNTDFLKQLPDGLCIACHTGGLP